MDKEMIQNENIVEEQLMAEDLGAAKGCVIGGCISLAICLILSGLLYLVVFYVGK